jgi:hypothetical protein
MTSEKSDAAFAQVFFFPVIRLVRSINLGD